MNINEITGSDVVKSVIDDASVSNPTYNGKLYDILHKRGFRRLGKGTYATVWGHPNLSYVLKIFTTDADVAYRAYLKLFVLKNQNNPWVPKIRGKLIRLTSDAYAVRMEKLYPASYAVVDAIQHILTTKGIMDSNVPEPDIERVIPSFRSDQNLRQLVSFITKTFPRDTIDIDGDNVMKREDGSIVITDPVAG